MDTLGIRIIDAIFHTISDAKVHAISTENRTIKLQAEDDRWIGHSAPYDRLTIHVSAKGFEPETHTEVWWIGANDSVQDAFWYEGNRRGKHE